MSGAASPSDSAERSPRPLAEALAPVRVRGGVAVRFERDERGATTVASLSERGGYRLVRPRTFAPHLEAMLVNTGGGVVGGDRVELDVRAAAGTDVVLTSTSAERVYRSAGAVSHVGVRLSIEAGARLDWLPQQTIVFAGARFQRQIDVDASADGQLLMAEILTFGRPASSETPAATAIRDHWRVRRDGRLVFAEALALDGPMADVLARPAVGQGARAAAVVLLLAPDAADRLERARAAIARGPCECGASAWNGFLCVRALATHPSELIATVFRAIEALTGRKPPRVWSI